MDPFSIALLLASGVNSILTNRANRRAQKRANELNIQLAREEREHRVNMWDRQNEYNSPLSQMERLSQAGLNPILAIDKGIGLAGSVSSVNPPTIDPVMSRLDFIPHLSNFIDAKQKSVQASLMEQQKKNLAFQAVLTAKKAATESLRKSLFSKDLSIKDKILAEKQLDITRKTLDNNLKAALFDSQEALFRAKVKYFQNKAHASEFMYEDAKSNSAFLKNFKKYGLGAGSKWYEKWLIRGLNEAIDSDLFGNSGSVKGSAFYKRGF